MGTQFRELLFGKPLRTRDESVEQLGVCSGIPVLGLDALASSAYGPEAALTILLPLGVLASKYIGPITIGILGVLFAVTLSYLQTIQSYPNGGGSYTVAKENLGKVPGLLAASALSIDYVLNVAVAISAGVGALVSMVPVLVPETLLLCLGILLALTLVNLRGVRSAGLFFMLPTYFFVTCLAVTIGIGTVKAVLAHGHPAPAGPLPHMPVKMQSAGVWLLLRAFGSGCTALTGIEAVSNAVPVFRQPQTKLARRTLMAIMIILTLLLAGVALMAQCYGISASPQGRAGYQSVLSQMVSAVAGRGVFYYLTMAAVLMVLCLSANTSFADFPRVCRLLALDEFLPAEFAHRGRRLVYSQGIIVLAVVAGVLLIAFGGITERLIPLFAVGAFAAFTFSQFGMVAHWKRHREGHWRRSLLLNAAGGTATGVMLMVILVSKFMQGAWLVLVAIPPLLFIYSRVRSYQGRLEQVTHQAVISPLETADLKELLIILPLKRLDCVARKALRLALATSSEVIAVQILAEEMQTEDLSGCWEDLVQQPARQLGKKAPKLVVVTSPYREFYGPLLDFIRQTASQHSDRPIAVMIPEVVEKRWYQFLVRHRSTFLKGLLLLEGGPQTVIITTPFYVEIEGNTDSTSGAFTMLRNSDSASSTGDLRSKAA